MQLQAWHIIFYYGEQFLYAWKKEVLVRELSGRKDVSSRDIFPTSVSKGDLAVLEIVIVQILVREEDVIID